MKCKGRKQFVPTTFTQMSIRAVGAALSDHFILHQADAELVNAKVFGTDEMVNVTLHSKADVVTLIVRPFQDGANINDIFQVTDAGYTKSWIRVIKDGTTNIVGLICQQLGDAVSCIMKPFSDAQNNDILQVTNAGYTKSHLAVAANGRVRMETGIASAAGLKHQRAAYGAIIAGGTLTITLTWTAAFPDANYTVTVSCVGGAGASDQATVISQTASKIDVLVRNVAAGTNSGGNIHAIAMHD